MESGYRVCTSCPIHHYENCRTCLGFGVLKDRRTSNGVAIPIISQEAHQFDMIEHVPVALPEWEACPECGSTPKGIPTALTPSRG